MTGISFACNPFFDPLAPAHLDQPMPDLDTLLAPKLRRRDRQTPAEHRTLRVISLLQVSSELERMVRERRAS